MISPGRCSLLQLQAEIERWESYVSRYEKKMKDKMDDEIKLAGLEALVPEELEKHLILNSNSLRTCEGPRLEIVMYVEAKVGLKIRDSKPSDIGFRSSVSRQAKENGHRVRAMDVLSAVEHVFKETAMQARTPASNRLAKAIRASHGPRVRAEARVKRSKGNPKDCPKEPRVRTKNPRVPTAHAKVKPRKRVSQVLKT